MPSRSDELLKVRPPNPTTVVFGPCARAAAGVHTESARRIISRRMMGTLRRWQPMKKQRWCQSDPQENQRIVGPQPMDGLGWVDGWSAIIARRLIMVPPG